ncbi:MAG: site-specific integrase, partial [Actinomycetota bacterium]|nr:site-specific integrase [Actinomycetota bacterium]
VRYAFFPVQAVFAYAARHRVIRYNPAPDVKLPNAMPTGREAVVGHFLSREQVAALAAEVGRTEPVYGLLVRFAAGVGLRASELTGLRVGDLRLAARQVDVVRTVKKGHPAGWIVDEPKSKRSSRTVPLLDDDLVEEMSTYLARHPRRADPAAPLWPARNQRGRLDYGTADAPRYWNQAAFYRNVFRPALAAVGLPAEPRTGVRWHDLRHTCVSQWLEDGHPMYEVSRWAGHASLNFTDRVYTHIAEHPDYSAALERTRLAKARKAGTARRLSTTSVVTTPRRCLGSGDGEG